MIFLNRLHVLPVCAVILAGCSGRSNVDTPTAQDLDAYLSEIVVAPSTSLLATGGTQQLAVTGTLLSGTPATGFDSVLYQRVTVGDTLRFDLGNGHWLILTKTLPAGLVAGDYRLIDALEGKRAAEVCTVETIAETPRKP